MGATLAGPDARGYNAAVDLVESNLKAGRGPKTAFVDDAGRYSYDDLAARVDRFANLLRHLGIEPEQRVVLALLDTIDFPAAFLGCIKAGAVPVAVNTLLTPADYDYMLGDSRARALVVSDALLPRLAPVLDRHPCLRHVLVSGPQGEIGGLEIGGLEIGAGGIGRSLAEALAGMPDRAEAAPTTADDMCFWLYSSGSTGAPKGTVHVHGSLRRTAELYAVPVLGIREDDVVYSAAKLFFAYGLGNALTFPMAVGATAVLTAERPTPQVVSRILREHRPTIFYGVPTLYGSLVVSPDLPGRDELGLRRCVSAGEALPAELGRRWAELTGCEILDGLGSTEMLHIFVSNVPGQVRHGTTGRPVPGYRVRLVDEAGQPVPRGEIGELQVDGPTAAALYWNNRERSRTTFLGPWTRSGDKYVENEDGTLTFCGRADDMMKVGGIYVSPFEVENALASHPDVQEAAVVAQPDEHGLVKPKAFVVLRPGVPAGEETAAGLQAHVKGILAPYKYPRWIEFLPELPKTATGKIQRFRLRAAPASAAAS
jgi:benzoate-CoA ligase